MKKLFSKRKKDELTVEYLSHLMLSHLTQEEMQELLEKTRKEVFRPAKVYNDACVYDVADV